MNDHISWLLMPGYILRLLDMAAALHKPYHKSCSDLIQTLADYGWLTCIRKTEYNAWYELTDKGQQVIYRLLCLFSSAAYYTYR
jgi:DNA-binding PadR family transcriptional regulator